MMELQLDKVQVERSFKATPYWIPISEKDRRYGWSVEPFIIKYLIEQGLEVISIDESINGQNGKGDIIIIENGLSLIYDIKLSIQYPNSISVTWPKDERSKQFWNEKHGLICCYYNTETAKLIIWEMPTIQEVENNRKDMGKYFIYPKSK